LKGRGCRNGKGKLLPDTKRKHSPKILAKKVLGETRATETFDWAQRRKVGRNKWGGTGGDRKKETAPGFVQTETFGGTVVKKKRQRKRQPRTGADHGGFMREANRRQKKVFLGKFGFERKKRKGGTLEKKRIGLCRLGESDKFCIWTSGGRGGQNPRGERTEGGFGVGKKQGNS